MRIIITALLIVLAFSGYMALSANYRFSSAEAEGQPVLEVHFEELQPASTTEEIEQSSEPEKMSEPEPEDVEEYSDADGQTGNYSSNNDIEEEIAEVFGTEKRIALAVAKAESGLNPGAINRNRDGSKDIGIFQINDRHGWSDEELLDWKNNIRIAKDLRDRRGWSEWAVYNNGSYRNYL